MVARNEKSMIKLVRLTILRPLLLKGAKSRGSRGSLAQTLPEISGIQNY